MPAPFTFIDPVTRAAFSPQTLIVQRGIAASD